MHLYLHTYLVDKLNIFLNNNVLFTILFLYKLPSYIVKFEHNMTDLGLK